MKICRHCRAVVSNADAVNVIKVCMCRSGVVGIATLDSLQEIAGEWSDQTFGTNRAPQGSLNHLLKEVNEALKEPYNKEEYADCLLLLLDAARLAGIDADTLLLAGFQKLEINKKRTWGAPDENGIAEHVRNR